MVNVSFWCSKFILHWHYQETPSQDERDSQGPQEPALHFKSQQDLYRGKKDVIKVKFCIKSWCSICFEYWPKVIPLLYVAGHLFYCRVEAACVFSSYISISGHGSSSIWNGTGYDVVRFPWFSYFENNMKKILICDNRTYVVCLLLFVWGLKIQLSS